MILFLSYANFEAVTKARVVDNDCDDLLNVGVPIIGRVAFNLSCGTG